MSISPDYVVTRANGSHNRNPTLRRAGPAFWYLGRVMEPLSVFALLVHCPRAVLVVLGPLKIPSRVWKLAGFVRIRERNFPLVVQHF